MNVVVLAAGGASVSTNIDGYPLCLSEFKGRLLIEILLRKWEGRDVNFAVMLRGEDIQQYHVDEVVHRVTPSAKVYPINAPTAGAACTALLAIEQINTDEPLVIVNGDELLDIEYNEPMERFESAGWDAGSVIFDSVHPRYSFVRLNEEGLVVEAAEKNPISRNATAGFYWYKRGSEFVSAAMQSIRKNALSESPYFICPVFNELVLEQKKIGVYQIEKSAYKPFKTKHQIEQFQMVLEKLL
jgi:dTDP-glucose pyrophosphorylase